jgi:4-diphosphocytidyl-2-C-methyl-D-erythritol kinase
MISFPNCKINLGLNIIGKRSDGYHEINSILYPIPLEEILEIIPISGQGKCKFSTTGLTIPGDPATNLCIKAYEIMNCEFDLPSVHIHLHKLLPMGGGLGGGSSDAAETIKLLNKLFDLQLNSEAMKLLAAQLGSDCPFFIENVPQIATGRGELLSPITISLKGYHLLLINDGTHVSTKEAYAGVQPKPASIDLRELPNSSIENWKHILVNDFEESVFNSHPHLKKIKKQLYEEGAIYAAMSGSGATLYGVFSELPDRSSWPSSNWCKIFLL